MVFLDREQHLGATIAGLTIAPRQLEAEQALIARLEGDRTTVLTKRAELEQQLADAPDCRLPRDDREHDRQQTLKHQLLRLRAGTLLCAPDRCYARVEDLDAQLTQSRERIERLKAQLATCLEQAEALLTYDCLQSTVDEGRQ